MLTRRWVRLAVGLGAITAMTLPAIALSAPVGASPLPAPTAYCPAVGADTATTCGYVVTVNGDGSVSVSGEQGPYDSSEDVLVGIVNDSDALVSSVTLSGSDAFGFDGDGICTYSFSGDSYCTPAQKEGGDNSVGATYEGPDNTFTVGDDNDGTVTFTTALPPGPTGWTYFSLEQAPSSGTAVLASDIVVNALPVTGTEGISTGTVQVAKFTDGPDTSPVTDFTATTNWGDGFTSTSTITAPAVAGQPYVVTDSHTYAEEASDDATTVTVTETDHSSMSLVNFGSASSSASIADAPLAPTATQPTIANATTGHSFTAPVATFTDANPTAPATDFAGGAQINWGDGNSSAGTISILSQPGGTTPTTFEVSGSHSYASNGTYTITVSSVKDVGGATLATITNTIKDYDAVITCSTSPCTGTATDTSQSTGASTSSTTGTILLDLNNTPTVGPFSCGDPFRHAPQYSTILASGLTASGSVDLTITFANSAAAGNWLDPFWVCYDSPTLPFTTLTGHTATLGLLPLCPLPRAGHPVVGPCIQSIKYSTIVPLPSEKGTVTEQLVLPPNDPFSH